MISPLIDPADSPERQTAKLLKVTEALMARVERAPDDSGEAYAHFQRAIVLEEQIRRRTEDLERTLDLLNRSNAQLSQAMQEAERARADLFDALAAVREAYAHFQRAIVLEEQIRRRTEDLERTLDLLNRSNAQLSQAMQEAERARADLFDALAAVREGFALFDSDDVLVMCNSRFGIGLPDVTDHLRPGLVFVDYAKLCARSPHLTMPDGQTRRDWLRRRLENHRKAAVNFNVNVDGDRWIQVSEQRTPGSGTAIIQTDITELIHLERQERDKLLDEQALLIRATLDHVNQGISIFDSQQRLVGWNARLRALLSPPIQLLQVGTSFGALSEYYRWALAFPGATGSDTLSEWVRHGENRRPLMLDLRTRDGRFLHVFGQEMPDRGFVISFSDVTSERAAAAALQAANEGLEQRVAERTLALEEALKEAERANASKSRFVAAASHDLLQPLSAAKLFLAAVEDGDAGSRDDTMRQVRSAFESVESILGALLDISRLDSGKASVTLSNFPLGRMLETLGQEAREIARQKGLDLRIVPTSVVVRSDASYLRRIVQNLLANAVRYTAHGKVLVGVRRIREAVRIEVWDTGPGIPENAREAIFHEFQRLERPLHSNDGVGLGLAIVERACVLLGHRLSLVSVLGRGSGFQVEVPRVGTVKLMCEHEAQTLDTVRQRPVGLVALVIENDEALRLALCTLLERWNVGVLDVPSGDEAVTLLDDIGITPDVILADFHLGGGIDGVQAIAAIRRRFGLIPAFLVTADRSTALAAFCEERSIPVLKKPLEPARLRALLAGIEPENRS